MDLIASLFTFIGYGIAGLFGLFVLAAIFGKRMETKWDLEAEFRDERGRKLGEFDIELRREAKEGCDWNLEASFVLRHMALELGREVQVYLDDELVMRGEVEKAGRIRLNAGDLTSELEDPRVGQVCSVRVGEDELVAETLYRD